MSEPQHPTPFGAHKGGQSGGQAEVLPGSQPERATSAAQGGIQGASLESVAAVGARLTQLREAKNWSLDDVSARLKVSPLKLRALENGDLSLFPDRNFAAGIVRSYAKIMGADPAPFTAALRQASGPVEQNLSLPASSGAGLPRGRVSVPLGSSPERRSWLWGVAAVVVAVIALAMWHTGGDSAAWLARLKASANGAGQSAGGETSASSSVTASDESSSNAGSVAPADTAAASSAATNSATTQQAGAQPMPSPLGTNALPASSSTISAVQGAAAKGASVPAAVPLTNAAKPEAPAPASVAAAVGTGSNTLELKVAADSWFSVRQKDGKEVFSGLVKADSVQRVAGEAPFKITIGNRAGLDSLTFDGQPVEAAKFGPAKGNVARFSLP
jgi:cytoskeleton protein RodZ